MQRSSANLSSHPGQVCYADASGVFSLPVIPGPDPLLKVCQGILLTIASREIAGQSTPGR